MSVKLRNLVWDWLQSKSDLKEHITLEYYDDGFYIETKCGGRFTMAWINEKSNDIKTAPSTLFDSTGQIWESQQGSHTFLNPADPEYFNKLEVMCRNWHNSYHTYNYGCKDKL